MYHVHTGIAMFPVVKELLQTVAEQTMHLHEEVLPQHPFRTGANSYAGMGPSLPVRMGNRFPGLVRRGARGNPQPQAELRRKAEESGNNRCQILPG